MDVIAIFGPTAVGKTDVAIALAEILRGRGEDPVAVSADALQVYRGLELLTGAAGGADLKRLEHRLISFVEVTDTFSAGRYARLAHAEIDSLLASGRRPIVVGGTGLYLRAALADLALRQPPPEAVRAALEERLRRDGPQALHRELRASDPAAAALIAEGDGRRIVRALEAGPAAAADTPRSARLWTEATRRPTLLVGLTMDRASLAERIDRRVDAIVAAGARAEVERAERAGASATARQAVGYRELLAGDVDAMKARTRRYAKRQMTWMRKLAGARLIDVGGREPEAVAAEIAAPLV